MNKHRAISIFILIICILSIIGNIYLYREKELWKAALFNQASSSANIEMLYKESGADTTYEGIKKSLSKSKYTYLNDYQEIDTNPFYLKWGMDPKTIKIYDAEFLFKDGSFEGSKVFIPNHH